ncbi:MAG: hypothetical protein ACE1ZQ_09755, partial [Ignavibacteriaceae bacterium]
IQLPQLGDPFRGEEDFRNLYWTHRMVNPDLFREDTLVGHQLNEIQFGDSELVVSLYSPGYGLLFLASRFFDSPFLFSKLLIFV